MPSDPTRRPPGTPDRSTGPVSRRLRAAGAAIAIVACGLALHACTARTPRQAPPLPAVEGAVEVGSDGCQFCHPQSTEYFAGGPHAATLGARCESCHGPASKHFETTSKDTILGPARLHEVSAATRTAICLDCHDRDQGRFALGPHAGAEVSCWDCHADALHGPRAKESDPEARGLSRETPDFSQPRPWGQQAKLCASCHAAVEADFQLQYHHPVPEGRMRCSDCHDPHGAGDEDLVVPGESCFSCHAEVRGPYMFEHRALDNGCESCHQPHGSTVEKLLTLRDNALCEQCHYDARYPLIGAVDHTSLLGAGALCIDCHFQVHGSNTDENLNPLRIGERRRGGRTP